MLAALENTCNLLSSKLLQAKHCTSFILTKVENEEEEKNTFEEHMQYLKEEYSEGPIGEIAANFEEINIYCFRKEDPKLEEGDALKQQITR